MPVYEFICNNPKCSCNKTQDIVELLCDTDEIVTCQICNKKLKRVLSATRGYVKGTSNYVPIKK